MKNVVEGTCEGRIKYWIFLSATSLSATFWDCQIYLFKNSFHPSCTRCLFQKAVHDLLFSLILFFNLCSYSTTDISRANIPAHILSYLEHLCGFLYFFWSWKPKGSILNCKADKTLTDLPVKTFNGYWSNQNSSTTYYRKEVGQVRNNIRYKSLYRVQRFVTEANWNFGHNCPFCNRIQS